MESRSELASREVNQLKLASLSPGSRNFEAILILLETSRQLIIGQSSGSIE